MFIEVLWDVVLAILIIACFGFLFWMAVHEVKGGE